MNHVNCNSNVHVQLQPFGYVDILNPLASFDCTGVSDSLVDMLKCEAPLTVVISNAKVMTCANRSANLRSLCRTFLNIQIIKPHRILLKFACKFSQDTKSLNSDTKSLKTELAPINPEVSPNGIEYSALLEYIFFTTLY